MVKSATRGRNILDKIFTNIFKYYNPPVVVASIGHSDHCSVVYKPLHPSKYSGSRSVRLVRDSRPANRRTVGVHLSEVNWTPHYYMGSCDDQYQSFSSVMNNIIDQYLPLRRVKINSNDKPWITPEIKDLISKRQAALAVGNDLTFIFYRNKIKALCKKAWSPITEITSLMSKMTSLMSEMAVFCEEYCWPFVH